MLEVAPGWSVDVSRGPDWLFVRLHEDRAHEMDTTGLADSLWNLLQQQFAHRLVLELDDVSTLPSSLLSELVRLYRRIHAQGGLMRLCGLSDEHLELLRLTRLQRCFPHYDSLTEAVMGTPPKPR